MPRFDPYYDGTNPYMYALWGGKPGMIQIRSEDDNHVQRVLKRLSSARHSTLHRATEDALDAYATFAAAWRWLEDVMMRLQWLVANQRYVFVWGDQIIPMGDERFFETRREAMEAARNQGLQVGKTDIVYALDVPSLHG